MADRVVGFVGVGRMGGPMAIRLLEAGYELSVFDTSPDALAALAERGAEIAGSPRDVASRAQTVLLSLPTPDIVREAALGRDGIAEGSAVVQVIDLSTTGPTAARAVAEGLARRDIGWIDAPVSGGVGGAKRGTLSVMVSCPRPVFDDLAGKLLGNFGRVFHVGEAPGMGQTAKLVNNLMSAAAMAIGAEGLALGVKAGLNARSLLDVINVSSGRSGATLDKFSDFILSGSFDFGFSTALSFKDVRLCLEEAEALGVPMTMSAMTRQYLALTLAKFGPSSDFTQLAQIAEDWAGVKIRA